MSEQESTLDEFVETGSETDSNESQELFGLGKIPADWEIKPLSESAQIIPGNSPPSSTYNEKKDGLPFFQGNSNFGHFHPKADTWCSDPRKEAKINDVLMSIRAPVGDLNIADTHCCIGRGLAALRPNDLNGLYLYYNLAERKVWLSRLATGSTFKAVSKTDLQLLDVPIPSLPEQRKIATVLCTVDQAIEKTETIIQQTERLQKGIRQDVFSLGVIESGNLRPADAEFIETYLGKIPTDWSLLKVDEVCSEVIDCPHSTPKYADDGIPVVRTSEIDDGQFDVSEAPRVTEEGYQERISRLEPEPGDVIFTREAPIGEAFKIPDGMKLCLGQRIMQLRPKNDILDSDFLVELLYSDIMQNWFERSARGSTSKHINVGDMKTLKIPVPSIEEQLRIDSVLGIYRKQLHSEQAYLNQLQRLKQGLMQDLLSGTVRTTDTNITVPDEVAQHD